MSQLSKLEKFSIVLSLIISGSALAISFFSFRNGSIVAEKALMDIQELELLKSEEAKIMNIIVQESNLTINKQYDAAVLLFDSEATIKDAAGGDKNLEIIWKGQTEIFGRYQTLPDFVFLKHEAIEITFNTNRTYARAIADTIGAFIMNGTIQNISSNQGEKWTFQKINGVWKITYFTFNLP